MIPSRRDEIAVEGLIDLFDREVTVDPEKHDPERRKAIKKVIARAREYYKQQSAAKERKKDDALRAKLDGEFRLVVPVQTTDLCSDEHWQSCSTFVPRGGSQHCNITS